ncbi:MAG TPA: porin, partial [Gammaproteobacteria bacterium]|nr:porin [Gammaproteobacteria bacterium]
MIEPEATPRAHASRAHRHGTARRQGAALTAVAALLAAPGAQGQDDAEEIADLRTAIAELRADYEQRIAELERRLVLAEQAAAASTPAGGRTAATPEGGSVTVGNAFNPQLSVILDGGYYRDEVGGEAYTFLGEAAQPSHPGHDEDAHGHEAAISNGFNLRTAELAFSAAVDPYFDATVYLALEAGGEIEIEEAWFATRGLPSGLRLKAGKFLSDIGYLNNKHPHRWDFADQNLAYENLLGGHGLQDTGLQLT